MSAGSNEYRRELGVTPVDAVAPLGRVERKRRKLREGDMIWREVLSETMGGIKVDRNEVAEDVTESSRNEPAETADPKGVSQRERSFDGSESEFESMMGEIRKMSDDPEGLIESHLSIFTDPAPPGRVLNSQG